ncbi:3-hydroxyacyl-CoA dehydrogenase [Acidocella aquatica]|uniref:3-hydroxyacyl-CoA dehydrogenase n=1 Tax=Acidocella aquatica TaxID=1922313 RepID=A0ABQ6A9B1_9PROT|nr:SDR family NAD(P)-dependent oxidoreductase [Acidocella aquatica]GLR67441.1 3-hydroxyacyl-CoA dehydrogenase [Acidocella aquatica]
MQIDSNIAAVVTGGASGLGLASVKALRAAGAKVAIFDLNPEAGERAAAETGAIFCKVNVLSDDSLDAAFAKARAANGQERVLVACAGGGNAYSTIKKDKATGAFTVFPTAEFAKIVALNAVGTFATITRFAAGAATLDPVDGERGAIVSTASVAAQDGQQGQAAYSAGKAAIIGMTLPIARDLSRFGIRINTILPGIFDTPAMAQTPQETRDALSATVPFPKRLGNAAEYASLVLELVRNGYFNAESIRLDGALRFAAR